MPFDFDPSKDVQDLSGKVIFVTGGTAGLGAETTLALAARNPARIYISGRNAKRAADVIERVKALSATSVQFVELDQGDLKSVAAAADKFLAHEDRLDVLIANAGVMATPAGLSKDGYETQFAINHMGHAALIKRMLPLLRKTADGGTIRDARIILLTSLGFQFASKGVAYDTIRTTQESVFLGSWLRYGQSKLANIWYARELAREYPTITSVAVHPGTVQTDLVNSLSLANRLFVYATNIGRMIEPHEGAYNTLWAAGTDKSKLTNGVLYEPVGQKSKRIETSKLWDDPAASRELWDWTQDELIKAGV